jgi:hypothetical protein
VFYHHHGSFHHSSPPRFRSPFIATMVVVPASVLSPLWFLPTNLIGSDSSSYLHHHHDSVTSMNIRLRGEY